MDILFELAEEHVREGRPEVAARHAELARRISMRYNIPLGPRLRRRYCRKCGAVLIPGRTSQVRTRRGKLNLRCLGCGNIMRFPLGMVERGRGNGPGMDLGPEGGSGRYGGSNARDQGDTSE